MSVVNAKPRKLTIDIIHIRVRQWHHWRPSNTGRASGYLIHAFYLVSLHQDLILCGPSLSSGCAVLHNRVVQPQVLLLPRQFYRPIDARCLAMNERNGRREMERLLPPVSVPVVGGRAQMRRSGEWWRVDTSNIISPTLEVDREPPSQAADGPRRLISIYIEIKCPHSWPLVDSQPPSVLNGAGGHVILLDSSRFGQHLIGAQLGPVTREEVVLLLLPLEVALQDLHINPIHGLG
mmetsp:Transcript_50294/g.151411  ORF Transcript_50294/g.151411 Transcript_50294/m.151411 type:complete len:235 (+) Transcript_50294:94-798(+)